MLKNIAAQTMSEKIVQLNEEVIKGQVKAKIQNVALMLKAIHEQESREATLKKPKPLQKNSEA